MQLRRPSQPQSPQGPVVSAGRLAVMVFKIACIIFVIESLVMLALYGVDGSGVTLSESMLDATMLTLFASPLIYLWVARPFEEEAAVARENLATQLFETQLLLTQNVRLKDRLQEFSAASADIHEKTLQKIGAELHDGPAQALTFSLLQIDRLLRGLERDQSSHLKETTTELRQVIQECAREIRGISTGLALPELRDMSLQDVVSLAVQRHRMSSGRTADVVFRSSYEPSLSHKACIYRVVQESLTNVAKHSRAEHVTVKVEDESGLTVAITDSGQGFKEEETVNKGLGLAGMRARVEALRGRFELKSAPNKGTTIVAHFDDPKYSPAAHHV